MYRCSDVISRICFKIHEQGMSGEEAATNVENMGDRYEDSLCSFPVCV